MVYRLIALACVMVAAHAAASPIPQAYLREAARAKIPAESLYAIALTESGYTRCKKGVPWPWSVNDNNERSQTGKSLCFKSREALFSYVWDKASRGLRRFDIGPMQLNWHYNKRLFDRYGRNEYERLWAASHPLINIRIGSEFIRGLIKKHGLKAMPGVYHAGPGAGRVKRKAKYTAVYNRHKKRLRQSVAGL